jgi:uncharacterized protein (TIGR00156 family)
MQRFFKTPSDKFFSGGILMKKYTIFFGCCLIVLFSTGTVFAQPGPLPGPQGPIGPGYGFSGPLGFTGQLHGGQFGYGFPQQVQVVSVAQARTYGHKVPVQITGTLVQFYGGKDLYLFRDSSGEILVKIGPKEWENLWYQGISIGPSDTIEIYGEIHWPKHSWGTPELHARFIRKR